MRTVSDTPAALILEDRPWALGLAIALLMVVMCLIGIGMIAAGEPWGGATFFIGGLVMAVLTLWGLSGTPNSGSTGTRGPSRTACARSLA